MLQSQFSIANTLLSSLPRAQYQILQPHLEEVTLTEGQILNEPGDTLQHVVFPCDALISLLTLVDGNDVFAVGLVGREGFASVATVLGSPTSPYRTLVLSSGTAIRIPAKIFMQEFQQSAALRRVMLDYVLSLTLQISQTSACNRFHVIEKRLARWLLMTRDRLSRDHFHMTHETLGHLLGVRRVGLTNAAHALKLRGLIDYSRGAIDILDGAGLQAASCSCYRTARGRQDTAPPEPLCSIAH